MLDSNKPVAICRLIWSADFLPCDCNHGNLVSQCYEMKTRYAVGHNRVPWGTCTLGCPVRRFVREVNTLLR